MNKNRRDFLKTAGVLGAGSLLGTAQGSEELNTILQSSFNQIGFDPTLSDSGFIVLLTDIHMAPSFSNLGTTEIDQRIIDEVNGMVPAPEMIIVAGDLATAATEYTGKVFTALDETRAREEMELGMAQLARFNSSIPIKIIPGNHDTYSYEVDAALWNEYTNSPPYFTFNFNGLKFIMLNSAHDGALDAVQQTWFEGQVTSALSDDEIYVVAHHPLGSSVGGRGVNEAMKNAFTDYAGDVWYSSGHIHNFRFNGYTLSENTNVIQSITATASPDAFNPDGKSPGYSLICVSNGGVSQHYHRDVKTTTIVARPNPNRNLAWPDLPVPFEEFDYPLLVCEEGKYDRADFIHSVNASDVSGTWWSYVDALELDFDLTKYDKRANQIVFLGSYRTEFDLFSDISIDGGVTWTSVANSVTPGKFVFVDIPPVVQTSDNIRLRLSHEAFSRFTFNFFMAGFALIPDPSKITDYDRWRWEWFSTIINQGDSSSAAILTANNLSNLEKFAFNVSPDSDDIVHVDPEAGTYYGLPKINRAADGSSSFNYVKRKVVTQIGIEYSLQKSDNLSDWSDVNIDETTVDSINSEWDLVTFQIDTDDKIFLRVRLSDGLGFSA